MAVQAIKISFALNINEMKWQLFSHANPNSPAYCLANLATSSLLNTYCLLANQYRNNSTVRTVTPANTRSLKMILSRDMAEQNAQTHRQVWLHAYREADWRGAPLTASSWSGEGGNFTLSQSRAESVA